MAGIIPGPKEPKCVNSFLVPLVKDMQKLYDGVNFPNSSSLTGFTTIRCVLGCVVCDLPATRKVCGFANFNGNRGCSKYMKTFITTTFGNKPSNGGFNSSTWISRDLRTHKLWANQYAQASTASEQKKIVRERGVKFSVLSDLPNFDIIRCHAVDPMHNIFLGLAKHVVNTWKDIGILQLSNFTKLQEKVDSIVPPPKVGRIPRKIESGLASFTADEWKNFILIYSSYALKGIVDTPHYKCWCLLVSVCSLLYRPILSRENVDQAHILLEEFCNLFETLYGTESCTPNMHMSLHLKECVLDFGPLPAFWCFAFERYNGILEDISKSWISPEKQMFLKFSQLQKLQAVSTNIGDSNQFLNLIFNHVNFKTTNIVGSLGQQLVFNDSIKLQDLQNISGKVDQIDAVKRSHHQLVPPYKEKYFNSIDFEHLTEMYRLLYPSECVEVSHLYREHKSIII